MNLENVYCIGCKTRHAEVEISEVKTIHVRGSPRTQAKGTCPEGKTWTKILNKAERALVSEPQPVKVEVELLAAEEPSAMEVFASESVLVEDEDNLEIIEMDSEGLVVEADEMEAEDIEEIVSILKPAVEEMEDVAVKVASAEEVLLADDQSGPNDYDSVRDRLAEAEVIAAEEHPEAFEADELDGIEEAYESEESNYPSKAGRHFGATMANEIGGDYKDHAFEAFQASELEAEDQQNFMEAYESAGEEYLAEGGSGTSPATIAAMAAGGIGAAYLLARLKKWMDSRN